MKKIVGTYQAMNLMLVALATECQFVSSSGSGAGAIYRLHNNTSMQNTRTGNIYTPYQHRDEIFFGYRWEFNL